QAGELEAALETACTISDPHNASTREAALAHVAAKQAGLGDFKAASETIARIAITPEDLGRRDNAWCRVAIAQAEAGRIKEAFVGAGNMTTSLSRVHALLVIAKAQVKAREPAAATKTFKEAEEIARGLAKTEGAHEQPDALCQVVRILAEQGEMARALKFVGEHLKDKWNDRPDRPLWHKDQWSDLALYYVARAQAERGDAEGALRSTLAIKNPQAQSEAFCDAALAQLRAGNAKGALRTGKGIEDAGNRVRVMVEVARVQAKGNRTGATKLLREALEEARR